MLLITCPWCSERDQTEFSYHGEAHIARPLNTTTVSDQDWTEYLFYRTNPAGPHRERWMHAGGCRRWFNVLRNTASGEILAIYRPTDTAPEVVL